MPDKEHCIKANIQSPHIVYELYRMDTGDKQTAPSCRLELLLPEPPPSYSFFHRDGIRFDFVSGLHLNRVGVIYHFEKISQPDSGSDNEIPVHAVLPVMDLLDLQNCRWLARAASIKVPYRPRRVLSHSIRLVTERYFILSSGDVLEYTIEESAPK